MSKILLELNPQQVEGLVEKLSIEEKLRLVRRLEKETYAQRWDKVFRQIDEILKTNPVSEKEIDQEIESFRRQKYVKSHH